MYFASNDGSQNTFVYQPTLDTLKLKKEKGTDYVLSWKPQGVFNSKPMFSQEILLTISNLRMAYLEQLVQYKVMCVVATE